MTETLKWTVAITVIALSSYFSQVWHVEAKSNKVVINSIVQRVDGVYFGVSIGGGPEQIISAGSAKVLLENTCGNIRFSPGVMQ